MISYVVRSILAFLFPTFLVLIMSAMFILVAWDYMSWKEAKETIEIVAPVVTGYIGSIIGYYFSKN